MPTPAAILPADLVPRHDLIRRLYLDPVHALTPARPWAPLTDAEWAALAPLLAGLGIGAVGRPVASPRDRLDAIFRAVTLKHPAGGRAPWRQLPDEFGKPDTISRTHRRWAAAGLWARLLVAVAGPRRPAVLAGLTHRICCAFRRAIRVMGLPGLVLARRLRLYSALPAPSGYLPDPDLSEIARPALLRLFETCEAHPGWRPPRRLFRALDSLLRLAGGRRRFSRWMELA